MLIQAFVVHESAGTKCAECGRRIGQGELAFLMAKQLGIPVSCYQCTYAVGPELTSEVVTRLNKLALKTDIPYKRVAEEVA